MKGDVTLHYRIEVYTDAQGRWFAQVEESLDGTDRTSCEWTKTADTALEALELAQERVRRRRA
jgi:hypothetical protein